MRNILGGSICVLAVCIVSEESAAGEEKLVNAGVSIQQIYDSNFSQNQIEDEEQITLSSVGASVNKKFSRQQLVARGRLSNYQHNTYTDFDATVRDAQFNWKGKWFSQFNTELDAVRDERLAERIESFEKDIVKRDDAKVKLGYGNDGRLSFHVAAQQVKQGHSNYLREPMDYKEDIAFADAGYKTASESTVVLRFTSGDRIYINEDSEISRNTGATEDITYLASDLDFKYRQYELESVWALSPKTDLSITVAHLDREGLINDGASQLATLGVKWEITPKFNLQGGYSYRQPAVGETVDTPTNVQAYFVSALWQLSSKISLNSIANVREQEYEDDNGELTRTETLYNISPLVITYAPTYALSIVLETGWRENKSPISYREYSAFQAALSLKLIY